MVRSVERMLRRDMQEGLAIALLQRIGHRPVRAIEFAEACHVSGSTHETKRRRVREIVERLHAAGHRVCASSGSPSNCGYWLARDAAEWEAYRETRRRGARFEFAAMKRMQNAAVDRISEQSTLFGEGAAEEHGSQSRGTRAGRTAWATREG